MVREIEEIQGQGQFRYCFPEIIISPDSNKLLGEKKREINQKGMAPQKLRVNISGNRGSAVLNTEWKFIKINIYIDYM